MQDKSKAKIFLSSERGCTQTERFRTYNTFNHGSNQNEYKAPFGSLYRWNDETLAGGETYRLLVEEDSGILLLPVVGAVEYGNDKGISQILQAGQISYSRVAKGTTIFISNPFSTELVNFLQGWFKITGRRGSLFTEVNMFDLNESRNNLISLIKNQPKLHCAIGKFDGRDDGVFLLRRRENNVFAFVIQGAFEVQNRLLESGDGLALWETEEIEFEALSNEAIILFIEMDGQG